MKNKSVLYVIWEILYPLLAYFLLDLLLVWGIQNLMPAESSYSSAAASIVFLAASILMCWYFYRRDSFPKEGWLLHHCQYMPLLLVLGALASHGLSAFVSFLNIDRIIGNYTEIENSIFAAPVILVIIQTVILAPISEELLFRGILYQRLKAFTGKFWLSALISSLIFGVYHLNLAQGIFAFLFGLLACAVYDKIQNLWASILLHIGGNLLSVILVYTGLDYPSTTVWIIAMILALAAAWAIYHFLIRPLKARIGQERE